MHASRTQQIAPRSANRPKNTPPQEAKTFLGNAQNFAKKVTDDGVTQFAGMLAYSLLLAVAPLLVGLLGIVGFLFFVTGHSSADLTQLITERVSTALPAEGLRSFTDTVQKNAGTLGVIGIITSVIAGAGFFQNVDFAFSVILRLKQRAFIQQWLMAIGMVLLLIPLIVVIVLATSIPQAIAGLVSKVGQQAQALSPVTGALIWLLSLATGVLAAFILFLAIYFVVPNQKVKVKEVFWGALLAALLLELYTLVFPLYASKFLKPSNYGASMGFALIVLVFFYYFAVILLIGVEINSWRMGRRDLQGTLPEILHKIDEHGAAIKPGAPVPSTQPEQRLDAKTPEDRENRPPDQNAGKPQRDPLSTAKNRVSANPDRPAQPSHPQRNQPGRPKSAPVNQPGRPKPTRRSPLTPQSTIGRTSRQATTSLASPRQGISGPVVGLAVMLFSVAMTAIFRSRFPRGLHLDIDLR